MTHLRFHQLCIDVSDDGDLPDRVASFWAHVLGRTVVLDQHDRDRHLAAIAAGDVDVWVTPVPESLAGKSRVHVDLRVADGDPTPLLAAGATVVREPGDDPWWVLADPDGVALCVFAPHPMAPDELGPFELVVDSNDPSSIAEWWATLTGGSVGRRDGTPFAWVEGADGFPWRYWVFHEVPEAKSVKNRVHWDVTITDGSIDDLVAAGATVLRRPDDEIWFTVMADPQGNEFCVFDER